MGKAYERLFYIFKTMDDGWGNPGGFIKVEINGDNSRLHLSLNNLEEKKGLEYTLFGISKDYETLRYTDISPIAPVNGRADVKVNFSADSIGPDKLNIHDINVFAVIARYPDKAVESVTCPLVTYTKGEQIWKSHFEELFVQALRKPVAIPEQSMSFSVDASGKANINYTAEPDTEQASDTIPSNIAAEIQESVYEDDRIEEPIKIGQIENKISDQNEPQGPLENDTVSDIEIQPWTILDEAERNSSSETAQQNTMPDVQEDVDIQSDFGAENVSQMWNRFQGDLTSVYKNIPEEEEESKEENGGNEDGAKEIPDVWQKIQDDFNDISSMNINKSVNESADVSSSTEEREQPLSVSRLRDELDKSFEIYNPFNTRNRGYKWWKINSPGFLNNILFRNNIKTYLLFNPKVMLAHYKYRYIILGIRSNRQPDREKLICGVPGVYNIDDNPFGGVGSWVQLEGYRPKYGAFGYWIVMLDPRTGKLFKIK